MQNSVAILSDWYGLAGPAIVEALIQCGFSLVVNGPQQEILNLDLGEASGKVIAVEFNVDDEDHIQQACLAALEYFGQVDVLVNNLIAWNDAPLDGITEQMWEDVLSRNVRASFRMARAVAPCMMAGGGKGRILNLTSTCAHTGMHLQYAASCAALHSMTRSLARELSPDILVNSLAFGTLDEPWIDEAGPELRAQLVSEIPLGRLCTPFDVAEGVAYLSTGADFMTGQMLVFDGGETMR